MSGCHPAATPSGRTARGKGLTVRIRLRTRRARLLVSGLLVSAPIGTAQSAAPARADGCGRPAAHLHPGRHLPSRSAVAHPEPVRARPRTVEEESDSAVSPCGARLESNRRAHRYHRCAGGSRFRAAPHAPTHPRPVTGSRRSPSGRWGWGAGDAGPAPGRAVCLGQHRGVDRVAEGTRRRGLGRGRPLRRCGRPNRQLGPERPPLTTPGGGRESGAGGVDVPATPLVGRAARRWVGR